MRKKIKEFWLGEIEKDDKRVERLEKAIDKKDVKEFERLEKKYSRELNGWL